jgi:sulfur carrier protein ThiS adenylyltransferase
MGWRGGDVLMNAEKLKERYSRQQDIVPAGRISSCKATVIGVGAIGRQVALQLAAIGIPWLQLIDPDIVEESNLASQGYREMDLNEPKAESTADSCAEINGYVATYSVQERFRRDMETGNVVFCCVDKIDVRKLIWQAVKNKVRFFCDGRMSAEVVRILTACDYESRKYYPTTLFAEQEAYAGSCTAKTTVYCANVVAGLMLAQFAKYLRRLPVDPDVQLNLLTSEISVAGSRVVTARD